jgi:hypothetical protein
MNNPWLAGHRESITMLLSAKFKDILSLSRQPHSLRTMPLSSSSFTCPAS